jgi:hypothetical protein
MLLRQRAGGRIVGFVALLHAISGLLVYTAVLLFLRGFARETFIGSLLDVPVLVPMLLFTLVVLSVWVGRTLGVMKYGGPLQLIGPNEGFTGHAGEPLRRRFIVEHEWTLLERYEPTVLAAAGLVLGLIPWTRVIGLYLVLAAIAAAWQSTRDRRANVWEHDPDADFAKPLGEVIASGEGVEIAFDSLGEMSVLLDETAAERAANYAGSDTGEPEGFISVAPGVAFKPRGPISVHRKPRATPVFMGSILLLVGNFAVGDVLGLYERAPVRWIAAVESMQSAGVALGLVKPESEGGPGELTDAFLEKVDSDALDSWKDSNARTVIKPSQDAVIAAEAAVQQVRLAVVDQLGFELSLDSHSELFDELLLTKESVREAWATLLNSVSALDTAIAEGKERLRKASLLAGSASLDEVRAIREQAEDWKAQADGLHTHIEHIRVMLDTLRLERALNQSPQDEGG